MRQFIKDYKWLLGFIFIIIIGAALILAPMIAEDDDDGRPAAQVPAQEEPVDEGE